MRALAVQVFLTSASSRDEGRHKARSLVREGLRRWGLPHIFVDIDTNAGGRPRIAVNPSFNAAQPAPDISFSHAPGAPGLTAVALGRGCRVGVDVEPLSTHFPPPMFARIFSTTEMAHPLADPVQLWTRKEALLKADGRGVSMDLSQLDVLEDRVELEGTTWHLYPVDVGAGYVCCVAADVAVAVQVHYHTGQL